MPDKKKSFPFDDEESKCGGCRVRNLEDIPDDIMEAAKSLVMKKETDNDQVKLEKLQETINETLQAQQAKIERIESQIQLLLQICSKK